MNIAGPSRVHLTASKRCRKQGESFFTIPETEEAPQIEESEEDEESEKLIVSFLVVRAIFHYCGVLKLM